MRLFEFGNTDYTHYIRVGDYQINRLPLFTTWTDGNNLLHRDVSRYQLSGSLTVNFSSPAEQIAFLAALNGAIAADGTLPCKLYAVNENAVYSANVFMDFSPKDELPNIGRIKTAGIQIKITER